MVLKIAALASCLLLSVRAAQAQRSSSTELAAIQQQIDFLQSNAATTNDVDTMFLLLSGVLVFFMQCGFACVEVGSVHPKNTKSILVKNIVDAAIGALVWWLVGFGLAFGDGGSFAGRTEFAFSPSTAPNGYTVGFYYAFFFFEWAFAATSATIVSGAVAERVKISGYVIYSLLTTSFIYPPVARWVWDAHGWASARRTNGSLLVGCGVIDFSGSGVVHMTGGTLSLIGAAMVGPRRGRFGADGAVNRQVQQSAALNTLGTLILWVSWFMFNGAGVIRVSSNSQTSATAMVNTAISPSAAVAVSLVFCRLTGSHFDSFTVCNTLLAGLVAITSPCASVSPAAAFVIGVVAGIVYLLASKALLWAQIDDVVEATAVHGACGTWGMLSAGLFGNHDDYAAAYGGKRAARCCGAFYGCGGHQLAAQLVFMLALLAWVGGCAFVLFTFIRKTVGLRVSELREQGGMDKTRHGVKNGTREFLAWRTRNNSLSPDRRGRAVVP